MKKVVAVLMAICLFVGCSSGGVSQAEYDKLKGEYNEVVAERDALKSQQNCQPEETSSPPTLKKDIAFDDGNSASFMLFEDKKPVTGNAVCFFDGKDPSLEYARLMAFAFLFEKLEIKDYTVMSSVENDDTQTTVIICTNGIIKVAFMSEKYKTAENDGSNDKTNRQVLEECEKILEQIK